MNNFSKATWGICLLITLLFMPCHAIRAAQMNVQTHTPADIRNYIQQSGASIDNPVVFQTSPSVKAPYAAGTLSGDTLQSALGILNQVRYIAGLDADVALNAEYTLLTQAAALVNAANRQLSHYPNRPSGMDDELYGLGHDGASSSNLGMGYRTLGSAIVHGWMDDSDYNNINRVGHRRWLLNPPLKATGFGYVGGYCAVYVFNATGNASYTNVAWPAQNMPLDYFGNSYAWSLSTGSAENINDITVTMVRQRDQKQWTFSKNSSDGDFYVDNNGYGQAGCIIFRPDSVQYQDGDSFAVTITGTRAGTISYTVNFFGLMNMSQMEARQPRIQSVRQLREHDLAITWQKEDSVDGYTVYLSTNADSGYQEVKTVRGGQTTSCAIYDLDNTKTYYVKIRAFVEKYGKTYYTMESAPAQIQMKTAAQNTNPVTKPEVTPQKPKATSIVKLTAKKKGFTVKWKKQTKQTSGYEVAYSTNKKFPKKGTTIKKISKNKTVSKTISGLKAKKKYYVRIRTYRITKTNGKTKKLYSGWSKIKSVTTKK
ncbi:MAG TPA: secretory protein [Lachnospiraceae bacterium]|nr:secretory protein [Lachnospiraceae bacterium]